MKEIQLSQGKVALVDDDVFEHLSTFKWYAYFQRNTWYAVRDQRLTKDCRFQLRMHSFIIGSPMPGFEIDHINGDGLDNRRENLRIVSRKENQGNRYYHRSGEKKIGATFDKRRGVWNSNIYLNGHKKYLGAYKTAQEASNVYKEKLKELIFK